MVIQILYLIKLPMQIDNKTHLIINADDPIVSRFKLMHKGKLTTYGVGRYIDDFKKAD